MTNSHLAYFVANRICIQGIAREDLEQEALIALFEASNTFDAKKGAKFSSYAYLCIKHRLGNIRQKERSRAMAQARQETLRPIMANRVVSIEDKVVHRQLLDIIEQLPPREEFVIKSRIIEGLTLQEIGNILGITRERVRQIEKTALREVRYAVFRR